MQTLITEENEDEQMHKPLIIALIVKSTKLVGTTTVASKAFMARFRHLKFKQQFHVIIFVPDKVLKNCSNC